MDLLDRLVSLDWLGSGQRSCRSDYDLLLPCLLRRRASGEQSRSHFYRLLFQRCLALGLGSSDSSSSKHVSILHLKIHDLLEDHLLDTILHTRLFQFPVELLAEAPVDLGALLQLKRLHLDCR